MDWYPVLNKSLADLFIEHAWQGRFVNTALKSLVYYLHDSENVAVVFQWFMDTKIYIDEKMSVNLDFHEIISISKVLASSPYLTK